ncbi:MAG: 23S rRNA (uracil(1939)-C(5))-methyltransferase RlmD [Candidatus Aenigmarchaeota archaeon]|nr:23S rRNA (uracil(1939)-C(5))-methyltransferase RlmD [Candidatus Aenigmarchaeota archaeon]
MICKHFGVCGGCLSQNVPYAEQVRLKEERLSRLFNQRTAVIPCSKVFFYRNRMDFVCSQGKIGLRQKGRFNDVVQLQECFLMSEEAGEILSFVNRLAQQHEISYFDMLTQQGFLRYVVLREGKFTHERMVSFVTNGFEHPGFLSFLTEFHQFFPMTSMNWLVNTGASDVSTGTVYKSFGKDFIIEKFDALQYVIRPNTFFQTNSFAALTLFRDIKDRILPKSNVLDLYCGVGAISLFVAERANTVHGIEIFEDSVIAAKDNARINRIANAAFSAQDLNAKIELMQKYDVFITDPPRSGLSESVIASIFANKPGMIISVSCNPETHKRDIDRLSKEYALIELRGYDFFPHTDHVETMAVLELKK